MTDTIRAAPPEEVRDKPPTEPPPSTTAIVAAFADLEEKLIRQLNSHHDEQLAVIREGQDRLVGDFQETQAVVRAFGDEFGRAVAELQGVTHRHARAIQDHTGQLNALSTQQATFDKRQVDFGTTLKDFLGRLEKLESGGPDAGDPGRG